MSEIEKPKRTRKVKPVQPPIDETETEAPPKTAKKPRAKGAGLEKKDKPKRVMTEKQLEALRIGREKRAEKKKGTTQ
jgi:hypothetical protein